MTSPSVSELISAYATEPPGSPHHQAVYVLDDNDQA
jgi:hypothetical protein